MRGPPITVTCECGETRRLAYGERWACEVCGRTWDTAQIPEHEYRGLVRDIRRYKLEMVGLATVLAGVLVGLSLLVNPGMVLMVPIVLGMVFIVYGPAWKRKVRRRVAERPRWNLRAEPE